jgi:hypothetical protein
LAFKELETLRNKHFKVRRLEDVKNAFLFSCFTGLAYIDVRSLNKKNLVRKEDGSIWIFTHTKNQNPFPHTTFTTSMGVAKAICR